MIGRFGRICFLGIIWSIIPPFGQAGGPLLVAEDGTPQRWDTSSPVPFRTDPGPLGTVSNEEARDFLGTAFAAWTGVTSASISFQEGPLLPTDVVTADDLLAVRHLGGSAIVFDSDGVLTDDLFGEGASDTTLGFATPQAGPNDPFFSNGFIVINGKEIDFSDPSFFGTLVHEIGHLLGLDHTQVGLDGLLDGADAALIPVMFPFSVDGQTGNPLRDDIAWLSWLYPSPEFATFGAIEGLVTRRAGNPFQGAHVVAVKAEISPAGMLIDSESERVSSVSDFRSLGTGEFVLPGLQPGVYHVFVEPLFSQFVGGSGVGPFDFRFEDFPKDFFNGAGEGGDASDDPFEKNPIDVSADQTVTDISLVTNETANELSRLTDDDSELFHFPEGFLFPFFGQDYSSVVVNSDGNLTFGEGDSQSTARDVERFLSGPPRIAPLFTDLNPDQGGRIFATLLPGGVAFTWQGVPEFSFDDLPGNTFTVTLFETGNVRFRYDSIGLQPGGPEQAIVGITPGANASGSSQDLSPSNGPFLVSEGPIFELFEDDTFDLSGRSVFLSLTEDELYFPFYFGNREFFTGLALSNFGSVDAELRVAGFGSEGELLDFPDNPQVETVDAGAQLARLASQMFGIPLEKEQTGWIRVGSSASDVASFFQIGNGLEGSLNKMDGSTAFRSQAKIFYFTRVYQGTTAFPTFGGVTTSGVDAVTIISVANPNAEPISLTLSLFNSVGQVQSKINWEIAPRGHRAQSVDEAFGPSAVRLADAFIRVEVTEGAGAVGFELVELPNAVFGLNALFENASQKSFSAQLATGSSETGSIFTNLKLINASSATRVVNITAVIQNEDGSVSELVQPNVTLNPFNSLQLDISQVFPSLGLVTSELRTGSIRIEADGPGVLGDVTFGDPLEAAFTAALPLQNQTFTRAVFSQVANGGIGSEDPTLELFTGVALYNPDRFTATVTLQVFDKSGNLVGETQILLEPNQRIDRLVEVFVPETQDLVKGYIIIESDVPIVAQQLFGNDALTFLSSVLPNVIR